jgi:hypothetical protein
MRDDIDVPRARSDNQIAVWSHRELSRARDLGDSLDGEPAWDRQRFRGCNLGGRYGDKDQGEGTGQTNKHLIPECQGHEEKPPKIGND